MRFLSKSIRHNENATNEPPITNRNMSTGKLNLWKYLFLLWREAMVTFCGFYPQLETTILRSCTYEPGRGGVGSRKKNLSNP